MENPTARCPISQRTKQEHENSLFNSYSIRNVVILHKFNYVFIISYGVKVMIQEQNPKTN